MLRVIYIYIYIGRILRELRTAITESIHRERGNFREQFHDYYIRYNNIVIYRFARNRPLAKSDKRTYAGLKERRRGVVTRVFCSKAAVFGGGQEV